MRSLLSIAVAGVLLVGATRPAPPPTLMFPALVMLRGGGVNTPVAITHAGATGNAFLSSASDVSRDTIAIIYSSLRLHATKSAEQVRRRPYIEVAEFFGAAYVVDSSGRVPPSQFEKANHHSRIYLPAAGQPALWENPVVAPGGARDAFYTLGEPATRALEMRGFKVRARR